MPERHDLQRLRAIGLPIEEDIPQPSTQHPTRHHPTTPVEQRGLIQEDDSFEPSARGARGQHHRDRKRQRQRDTVGVDRDGAEGEEDGMHASAFARERVCACASSTRQHAHLFVVTCRLSLVACRRAANRLVQMSRVTPTVIAESATLNTGHTRRSMKSST